MIVEFLESILRIDGTIAILVNRRVQVSHAQKNGKGSYGRKIILLRLISKMYEMIIGRPISWIECWEIEANAKRNITNMEMRMLVECAIKRNQSHVESPPNPYKCVYVFR